MKFSQPMEILTRKLHNLRAYSSRAAPRAVWGSKKLTARSFYDGYGVGLCCIGGSGYTHDALLGCRRMTVGLQRGRGGRGFWPSDQTLSDFRISNDSVEHQDGVSLP
jgi:hypothetical protein